MKTSVIPRVQYEQTHGPVGRPKSEETLAMWEKVKKLAVVEYLILEPEKGEKIDKLRSLWYPKLRKMAEGSHSNFNVRLALNKQDNHVVIWKEPKVAGK